MQIEHEVSKQSRKKRDHAAQELGTSISDDCVFVILQCSSGVKDPLPMHVNDSAATDPQPISPSDYPAQVMADTPMYMGKEDMRHALRMSPCDALLPNKIDKRVRVGRRRIVGLGTAYCLRVVRTLIQMVDRRVVKAMYLKARRIKEPPAPIKTDPFQKRTPAANPIRDNSS
jgi:hypothetical protein